MVGLYEPRIARSFCTAGLVRYMTRSAASFGCAEYRLTASCQPPSAAADWPPSPCGSAETPTLPLTGLSAPWLSDQAYGQLRMNTELPFWNTPRASSSP